MKPGPENDFRAGHRKRLREKFMAGKCVPYELLELLLMFAIPRHDVRGLARGLMCKFGGLHRVINASKSELLAYPGVGESTVVLFGLLHELLISEYEQDMKEKTFLDRPDKIREYCRSVVAGTNVEECYVFYLGSRKLLLHVEMHGRGTHDWVTIYPTEILKRALNYGAKFVILMHNHPSGIPGFSTEDVIQTVNLCKTFLGTEVQLLDHYVVAGDIIQSMRETTILNDRCNEMTMAWNALNAKISD